MFSQLKLKRPQNDDDAITTGMAIKAGVKITTLPAFADLVAAPFKVLIIGPGSGTGPSSNNAQLVDELRKIASVQVALPINAETGEVLSHETNDNLTEMGEALAEKIGPNTHDLIIAGSRGGWVVTVLLRLLPPQANPRLRFLVKNAFEAIPREMITNLSRKPNYHLTLVTANGDYMNNRPEETDAFFKAHWAGPVFHAHMITDDGHQINMHDGHQINMPTWVADHALSFRLSGTVKF